MAEPAEVFENMEELEEERVMDDYELAGHLQAHETSAIGYYNDQIADEQTTAIDYYYRRMPDLPSEEGTSSVVDGTVAIVIDNALSAILKPFVSSDETVKFSPRGPEDEEVAEQATDYCNYVFNYDNPGFMILHDWFKDALFTKIGVVKVWWDEITEISREEVIVDNELALANARQDEFYVGEEEQPDGTVLVHLEKREDVSRVKVENVPPEEYMITPFARRVATAVYQAHVPKNVTRSDAIEMGFDPEIVATLPGSAQQYDISGGESGRRNARYYDERGSGVDTSFGTPHESQEIIDIRDEYVRIDYDGDGIAELRRVVRSGDVILLNEEVKHVPFAVLCPVPMPHKVVGMSLADQVVDLQRISTAIVRQTLDNLYKTNNPRPIVGEGAERDDGSTQESVGNNSPGAAILVKDAQAFTLAQSVPFFAKESFGMLEYIEGQQEARTGIGRNGQGMDTDALAKGPMTAREAGILDRKSNARAEMIARIFAETGVKDLFKLILKLLVEFQPKERVIRLRNEWVEIDPSNWSPDMDMEISVGLGMGDKNEQMAAAGAMLEDFAILAESPYSGLIDKKKVYNALKHKYNAAGIKNIDEFLNDPDGEEAQQEGPEGPSPEEQQVQIEAQKAQQEMQVQQAKVQAEIERQAAKLQGEQQLAAARVQNMANENQQKIDLARALAAEQQTLARQKAEFEAELADMKAEREFGLAIRQQDMQREAKVDLPDNRSGGDLDK